MTAFSICMSCAIFCNLLCRSTRCCSSLYSDARFLWCSEVLPALRLLPFFLHTCLHMPHTPLQRGQCFLRQWCSLLCTASWTVECPIQVLWFGIKVLCWIKRPQLCRFIHKHDMFSSRCWLSNVVQGLLQSLNFLCQGTGGDDGGFGHRNNNSSRHKRSSKLLPWHQLVL